MTEHSKMTSTYSAGPAGGKLDHAYFCNDKIDNLSNLNSPFEDCG